MPHHQVIHQHMNQYVKVTMKDGKSFKGYVAKIERDHVILAVPHGNDDSTYYGGSDSREYRWFPFFWLGLPLAFIAGVAAARRPYYYPSYYYPSAASPYTPYYPYGSPYGYGY